MILVTCTYYPNKSLFQSGVKLIMFSIMHNVEKLNFANTSPSEFNFRL